MALDNEIKEHLDEKFDDFIAGLIKKFRWPAIGLAVIFAAFMSAFATYMYVKARSDVSTAQVQFYQSLMRSQKEIDEIKKEMIRNFNIFIEDFQEQKEVAETRLSYLLEDIERTNQMVQEVVEQDESSEEWTGSPEDELPTPSIQPRILPEEILEPTPIEPTSDEEYIDVGPEAPKKKYTIDPDEFINRQKMQKVIPQSN